jgi:glycosyltransferase involved in cell wall biosynthesis
MSILYLLTAPKPLIEGTDAVLQEVLSLKKIFGGEITYLSPWQIPGRPFPMQLFGLHLLARLRRLERQTEVNHVYHSTLYPFPVLRLLTKPIVYTVLTSLRGLRKPPRIASLARLALIVVSSERDAEILKVWGLSNYVVVGPGIDTSRLTQGRLPLREQMTLLMASAPWVDDQFDTKGYDALLDAVKARPTLRLILLWRGSLETELRERINARGIGDRVEVRTSGVEINDYLKRVHAAILPAKRGDIVKAFPHSLIESLVAGKPVVLSDALPMAEYVRRHDCGVVLNEVTEDALLAGIDLLQSRYDELASNAFALNTQTFSEDRLIASYREIYDSVQANRSLQPLGTSPSGRIK